MFAIIVQHTWAVLLLFFLFHLPAKELCDILLTAGLYSFLFMIGLLLHRWILGNKVQNKVMWSENNVKTNTSFCCLFPHETVSVYVKQLCNFPCWILLGPSKFDRAFLMCETAVLSWKVIFHSECWCQKCSDFLVALNASESLDRLETVASHCICFSSFSVWI